MNGIKAPDTQSLPTPPLSQAPNDVHKTITPPNRAASPHGAPRPRRAKKNSSTPGPANANMMHSGSNGPQKPAGVVGSTVPPINVLIVEDNVINLRLLEAFMKRLKVRWKSAMNGREAVDMWRKGGYHLVLMDIQLPIMNGLEATKEIRRLEGVNGIGVFSGSPVEHGQKAALANGAWATPSEDDRLPDRSLFMSPVIIVALTASSLQSDRHEALAAGCNDFLTKVCCFPPMIACFAKLFTACQLPLDGTQSDRMGLYASTNRLRWLALVEGLRDKAGSSTKGRGGGESRKEEENGGDEVTILQGTA